MNHAAIGAGALAGAGDRRFWRSWLSAGLLLCCVVANAAPAVHAADAERGRLLYETGRDASGKALQAVGRAGSVTTGEATACVGCHRPSTFGGIEGGLLVPPIRGDLLFAPGRPPSTRLNMQWMRHQTRSAYDDASLARALSDGRDPDGQSLRPEMPRYRLHPQDARDLAAYLRVRGTERVPGLVNGTLHVATVFTPDAPRPRRDTVMKVMKAWSQGLRLGAVPVVWQPWELQGPASGWSAQLEEFSRRTPVFALVSGAGGARWDPVESFCERQRIACLFPSIDRVPARAEEPRYTTYFSTGTDGEARMLGRLLGSGSTSPADVHQLGRGEAAQAAMRTLEQALGAAGRSVHTMAWSGPQTRPVLTRTGVLVLWLGAADVSEWLRTQQPGREQVVYLSAQLAPAQSVAVPAVWRSRVRWLSMRAAPVDFQGVLARSLEPWAHAVAAQGGIEPVEFAEARAAGFLFGDAAGLTQGHLQPDYLIERLETAVRQRVAASIYVQASLGPGQRVAAKGGFLLGYSPGKNGQIVQLSDYLRAAP